MKATLLCYLDILLWAGVKRRGEEIQEVNVLQVPDNHDSEAGTIFDGLSV